MEEKQDRMSPSMQWRSDTTRLLALAVALLRDGILCLSSHPLYVAYLLFFCPYLLHLLLFLSPLLLPTSLLLLLTLPHRHLHPFSFSDDDLTADGACAALLAVLSTPDIEAPPTSMALDTDADADGDSSSSSCEYLSLASDAGESPTEKKSDLFAPDSGVESQHAALKSPPWETGRSVSMRVSGGGNSESLRREGSMREWRKTLACKLYEERMTFKLCEERTVADGCEEMDLLWEAYEADAIKSSDKSSSTDEAKKKTKENKKKKKKKKREAEEEEEEEEREEAAMAGELCCLQALRLSAGKMNLGVGRPNLVKISKAFKGMALFHRVGSRRSRKG